MRARLGSVPRTGPHGLVHICPGQPGMKEARGIAVAGSGGVYDIRRIGSGPPPPPAVERDAAVSPAGDHREPSASRDRLGRELVGRPSSGLLRAERDLPVPEPGPESVSPSSVRSRAAAAFWPSERGPGALAFLALGDFVADEVEVASSP